MENRSMALFIPLRGKGGIIAEELGICRASGGRHSWLHAFDEQDGEEFLPHFCLLIDKDAINGKIFLKKNIFKKEVSLAASNEYNTDTKSS